MDMTKKNSKKTQSAGGSNGLSFNLAGSLLEVAEFDVDLEWAKVEEECWSGQAMADCLLSPKILFSIGKFGNTILHKVCWCPPACYSPPLHPLLFICELGTIRSRP